MNVAPKVTHASSAPPNTQDACPTFFNPHAPIDHSRRNLPHWYQEKVWWGKEKNGSKTRKENEHAWRVSIDQIKETNYIRNRARAKLSALIDETQPTPGDLRDNQQKR